MKRWRPVQLEFAFDRPTREETKQRAEELGFKVVYYETTEGTLPVILRPPLDEIYSLKGFLTENDLRPVDEHRHEVIERFRRAVDEARNKLHRDTYPITKH